MRTLLLTVGGLLALLLFSVGAAVAVGSEVALGEVYRVLALM